MGSDPHTTAALWPKACSISGVCKQANCGRRVGVGLDLTLACCGPVANHDVDIAEKDPVS